MTVTELIQRATDIALRGQESSGVREAIELAVEPLLIPTFAAVSTRLATNRSTRTMLRRANTLTFADGTAALPQTVLSDYLDESVLYDPADTTLHFSYQPDRQVFIRDYETRDGRYYIRESTVEVVETGSEYTPGVGLDGDLTLEAACAVEIPVDFDDPIEARDEVVEEILNALVAAITPVTTRRS
jgi:hypothetical protein